MNEINKENKPEKIIPLDRISNSNQDPNERYYKYLGVLLDENFTLNNHFDHLCKKLSKGLFCLSRAKNFLNTKALKTLYFALIHAQLQYCTLILSSSSANNIKRVLILQKKAIRIISHANYNDHTVPLFLTYGILPFDKILYFNKMRFMHGLIHGYNVRTFANTWPINAHRNLEVNLRNQNELILPFPRFEGFKRFPLYDFAKNWNELGPMKLTPNPTTFTVWLKNEIFRQLIEH